MANYAQQGDMSSYAPNDPPIDPILQLHRSYDEQQQREQDQQQEQQQLPSLPTDHHPGADYDQGQYPATPSLGGPSNQTNERDGFRPHQDPRPIIPPDVDTSRVDLTYRRNPRSHSANNPGPDGWLYPHKKGIGTGSNLEAFKDEIEARTLRGENCKAISAALNAMGVQTSDKAISRVRIKWGMRKRVSTNREGASYCCLSAVADHHHNSPRERSRHRLPIAMRRASLPRPRCRPCAR